MSSRMVRLVLLWAGGKAEENFICNVKDGKDFWEGIAPEGMHLSKDEKSGKAGYVPKMGESLLWLDQREPH